MIIRITKGFFELNKNFKDAFDLAKFEERYIEECFDQYEYIVGDVSSGIIRLKGFNENPSVKDIYLTINEYIFMSCPFQCPYFVLKRIKNVAEYEKMALSIHETETIYPESIKVQAKVAYDKENLILDSSPKVKSNVIIDMQRINSMPSKKINIEALKEVEQEDTVIYTSSSPNFVPKGNNGLNNSQRNNNNNNQKFNNQRNNNNSSNQRNNNNVNSSNNQKGNNVQKQNMPFNKDKNNMPKNNTPLVKNPNQTNTIVNQKTSSIESNANPKIISQEIALSNDTSSPNNKKNNRKYYNKNKNKTNK